MKNHIGEIAKALKITFTGLSSALVINSCAATQDNVHTTMNNGELTSSSSHKITQQDISNMKGKNSELISGAIHEITQQDINKMKNRKK